MNYLADYSTFNSKSELNQAVANHLSRNNSNLNETDRNVFLFISRYSVKYYGASHLKTTTIGDGLGKSRRTIQRSLKKLVDFNMIERIEFIRKKSGGHGANLYIILPFDDTGKRHTDNNDKNSTVNSVNEPNIDNEPISFNNNNKCSCQHDTYSSDSPITFYQRFKALLSNTIGQANKQASKLYGVYRSQSIKLMRFDYLKQEKELFEDLAIQALKITTQATKRKHIKNLSGYYSGVLQNLINKALFGDDYFKELEKLAIY